MYQITFEPPFIPIYYEHKGAWFYEFLFRAVFFAFKDGYARQEGQIHISYGINELAEMVLLREASRLVPYDMWMYAGSSTCFWEAHTIGLAHVVSMMRDRATPQQKPQHSVHPQDFDIRYQRYDYAATCRSWRVNRIAKHIRANWPMGLQHL